MESLTAAILIVEKEDAWVCIEHFSFSERRGTHASQGKEHTGREPNLAV